MQIDEELSGKKSLRFPGLRDTLTSGAGRASPPLCDFSLELFKIILYLVT